MRLLALAVAAPLAAMALLVSMLCARSCILVMIALFGLFADVERDLISERTRERLAATKTQGKRLDSPRGP